MKHWVDGKVFSVKELKRIGHDGDPTTYTWRCPEIDPIDKEWDERFQRRLSKINSKRRKDETH